MTTSPRGCQLVVFCGLPGVGKTTLSRRVADQLAATFLRIDTIEAAIVSTLVPFVNNPVGYVVAGWVAADQLRAGRCVVADAVNNVAEAREGWVTVARDCGVPLRFVEVTCSDVNEHRRRVETRTAEKPGHGVPTWEQVQRRPWQPLAEPHLVIDNIADPSEHAAAVINWLARSDTGPQSSSRELCSYEGSDGPNAFGDRSAVLGRPTSRPARRRTMTASAPRPPRGRAR